MPVFVDANVLVYARDETEGEKQGRASEWLEHLWRTREGRLSYQVLHEFYVTVTQKLDPGLSISDARADVQALFGWRPRVLDRYVLEAAWALQDLAPVSFWDALIVGAAQAMGCEHLLTEDLTDGETYGDVRVVDPFRHAPAHFDR